MSDEAHIPAKQSRPCPSSRFSQPYGNPGRSRRDPCAPRTRSQKAQRLIPIRKRSDFLAANSARRVATPGFVLLVRPRGDKDASFRLGITVTKKIGNAVVRNRMKRRFRMLARDLLPEQGIKGADHILIGRQSGIERDYAQLRTELSKALHRAAGMGQ
jgi:ribonuclease P protein component